MELILRCCKAREGAFIAGKLSPV